MPSSKPSKKKDCDLSLDTMQNEAIKKLQQGREFMTSAIDAIGAKYSQNETKAG
jgi:hypothetical protein